MKFFPYLNFNNNVCDHAMSEINIHFTKICNNHCPFCIDRINKGVNRNIPDISAIEKTLMQYKDYITEVTISGGEPFLFMDELNSLVTYIKDNTSLKITVMTSLPKTCYDKQDIFYDIMSKIDYLGLTPQHYKESIADDIRKSTVKYDRQSFYKELKYKEKIGINLNCCKPYLYTKDEILKAIKHYNDMGFHNIRICEMFNADNMYINICDTLGIKLHNPFASGCKTDYSDKIKKFIPEYRGKFYIKRICFLRSKKLHANIWDLIKMITRRLCAKKYFFGVIHENGEIAPYWI